MTDRKDPLIELVKMTSKIDDADVRGMRFEAERDRVFSAIVSSASRDARRVRRQPAALPRRVALAFGGAAVVVVVAAAILIGNDVVSPTRAEAAGIHFSRHGAYIEATIDDPTAPSASMEAAFAEAGLDIDVDVISSSPSIAGTITMLDTPSSFEPIYAAEGSCLLPGGATRCIIGMRVPAGFEGSASISVNGTPPPGGLYNSTTDAFAPGEALHCSGVRGLTVSAAAPILAELGVTPVWRTRGGDATADGVPAAAVTDQYISDAIPRSLGTVYLWVQPTPPEPSEYHERLSRGC
jgi:hypothetical protein